MSLEVAVIIAFAVTVGTAAMGAWLAAGGNSVSRRVAVDRLTQIALLAATTLFALLAATG
ncbi:hypothetical protein [Mesorhizobium sp. CAU 1732]|uniref:hypothetical protein n=1 Tax=Mesorhizobium sp. CAU 1732 TaxID=3140358 RepID=UPI00326133C9